MTGFAVDGYISGATVFADTDNDGVLDGEALIDTNSNGIWDVGEDFTDANSNNAWDADEAFTTTDANGQYTFGAPVTGPLVLMGGTDISTGNAFAGVLRAPGGATTITPLTTLVAALLDANPLLSTGAANGQVLSALGLAPTLDLSNFDPIAAALSGDANGAEAYAAAVTVQNTLTQAAAVLQGAGASGASAIAAVTAALAAALPATGTVDLGSAAVVSAVLTDAAAGTATESVVASVVTQTAAIISAGNALIAESTEMGVDLLIAVTQVAAVSQGGATADLLAAVAAIADTVVPQRLMLQ